MPAIFISYRREDSREVTRALASELATRFGDDMVFLDVEAIEAGVDFSQTILDGLRAASVVLVVIGPRWLTSTGDLVDSRLSEPDDFVRLEIETAQKWGAPIIPVLVGGATMPEAASLPDPIRALALNNAFTLQETAESEDAKTLADKIETAYGVEPLPQDARSYIGGRLAVVRRYPLLLARILRRPKRTLASRALGRTRDLVDAMVFLMISSVLAVWLMIAEWPGKSWELWFSGVSVSVIAVLLLSIPLYLSWRRVGAKAEYGRVFTILCYQVSVMHFLVGFAGLVFFMTFNLLDPASLDQFAETQDKSGVGADLKAPTQALLASPAAKYALNVLWIVPLLMVGWHILSWGAYRRSLGAGRLRSGIAFILCGALVLTPFIAVMAAVMRSL